MIVLAIDIGVTGAIAAVDSRGSASVADLPTTSVPGERMVRRELNPVELMRQVRQLVPIGHAGMALIERIHSMPGRVNSPQSTASLMDSRGVVRSVLSLARLQVVEVEPATWKRFFGLIGKEKSESLATARALYPCAQSMLQRQRDHNRGDALLIAHYGLRTLA